MTQLQNYKIRTTGKPKTLTLILTAVMASAFVSGAALVVTVGKPQTTGTKAVLKLAIENTFNEPVASAKASVFLLDENGKMAGQASKWVIGGTKGKPGLAAGATNTFYFVISSDKPLIMTNLTAKVSFSRVVLEGGKVADPSRDVQILPIPK